MAPLRAPLISVKPDCDPLKPKHLRNPGLTSPVPIVASERIAKANTYRSRDSNNRGTDTPTTSTVR